MGVALSSAILAAFAAVSSLLAGYHANEAMIDRIKSSDQWSYYQAKSIKQNLYEALSETAAKSPDAPAAQASQSAFNAKVAKYKADEEKIMTEAQELQKLRDAARAAADRASQHGAGMGLAIAIFQMAIALGSICLVTKKPLLWYLSMGFALLATAKMIQVWFS